MKRTKKGISQDRAIFLLLAGLFLGTIFTFGTRYWHAPVSREDCTQVNTEFVSYGERTRRGSIQTVSAMRSTARASVSWCWMVWKIYNPKSPSPS